ncbi:MAG TPA: serine/threonine protein kinase [Pirellulales bacterium]|nr:serine/threonine protein kinase [Pirellulales bacterium]
MSHDPKSLDRTLAQTNEERFYAQERSLQPARPPLEVPGYRSERFLGSGAYGQVWVAVDTNTGRRVAIKFYTHRGGLDWSLLSREVERLALLFADRYVVQLVDVGWDADPPYFVMEYLEQGSLADRLQAGPLPVDEAVELFREIAVGLVHAHGKGVLHCDLKPANVLLDQDGKPRLADFGQSRLSHEQSPSLGTLFYMAPEQADMQAMPDARWDVYALGALLYCMLTGRPPYRDDPAAAELQKPGTLEEQLARYRRLIEQAPRPREHRRQPGVDRELAEIVNRCLAIDPKRRYLNPQAALEALHARAVRRARRPLLVMGALGPFVLLIVMALFGWDAFETTVGESRDALLKRALESDRFAAQFVASTVARSIDHRWHVLEHAADDPEFRQLVTQAGSEASDSPQRRRLQELLGKMHSRRTNADTASWFVVDARGRQIARSPVDTLTLDEDFARRDYFHGQGRELSPGATGVKPIEAPHLSIVFVSEATGERTVALSVPIFSSDDPQRRKVIGVLGHAIGLGHFAELRADERSGNDQIAVLVDSKPDDSGRQGAILEHPEMQELLKRPADGATELHVDDATVKALDRLRQLRRDPEESAEHPVEANALACNDDYRDPAGGRFAGRLLAAFEPVEVITRPLPGRDTGWAIVVEEFYDGAVEPVSRLRDRLLWQSKLALLVALIVITSLWGFVIFVLNETPRWRWLRRRRGRAHGAVAESSSLISAPSAAALPRESADGAETPPGTKE